MHTYALPALLGIDQASGPDIAGLSITGTLASDAQVRLKPNGAQGDPVHVVCMNLQDLVPNVSTVHVEQPHADRAKADACAARLKKGLRVTVHCPLKDARLSLPNVQQIDIQPHLFTKP